MKPHLSVPVAFVTACLLAANATAATPRTITVSGTGIINSVPNEAQFSFGVTTTASTAAAALSANAARMSRVVATLERLGIRPAQLQTAEISLTPQTNQSGSQIVGYSASNSVTASTENVAKSGSIVDGAVGAGANLVSGPNLTPSDQQELSREALVAAMADAHARAATIAKAAGVRLGQVVTVTEQSSTIPPLVPGIEARAANASTPVEAGTVQTEEDLTVTFAIG